MKDRQPSPGKEGLMKHTPCDSNGTPTGEPSYYAKVDMADSPLVLGDTWSKGNVAPDRLAAALGLTDPQSADIADAIRKLTGCVDTVTTSGAVSAGDLVNVSGGVATKSLHAHAYADNKTTVQGALGVAQIDNTRFLLLTYSSSQLSLTLGKVSGKDVILGAPKTVSVGEVLGGWDLCEVATNKFVLDYRLNTSGAGYALVFTVNDLEITAIGTPVATGGGQCLATRCTKLDTDKFLHSYKDWPEGKYTDVWSVVCTVSGTTITVGTAVRYATRASGESIAISGSKVLAVYGKDGVSGVFYNFGTVSGTTITYGTEKAMPTGVSGSMRKIPEGVLFNAATGLALCSYANDTIALLSSAQFDASWFCGQLDSSLYLYSDSASQNYREASISGTAITLSDAAPYAGSMLGLNRTEAVDSEPTYVMRVALSTGKDAIALGNAASDAQVEVAYDGAAYVPGLAAGEYLLSGGVEGYVYRNNFVSIKGFWR